MLGTGNLYRSSTTLTTRCLKTGDCSRGEGAFGSSSSCLLGTAEATENLTFVCLDNRAFGGTGNQSTSGGHGNFSPEPPGSRGSAGFRTRTGEPGPGSQTSPSPPGDPGTVYAGDSRVTFRNASLLRIARPFRHSRTAVSMRNRKSGIIPAVKIPWDRAKPALSPRSPGLAGDTRLAETTT
ncbi:MAG: hypothetical protein PWQ46_824 [Methanomicrobiaceae archaeon]|nr:hypothetical protein [Methanomicrobiaceae archaeon]